VSRSRGLAQIAGVFVAVAGGFGFPEAVANKISSDAGRGEFQSVGGFIRAIL